MVDVRDRVAEDRGLLKKIQLLLPGFSGYRQREDLRAADSILRIQLADRLKENRGKLEATRARLAEAYEMKALEPLGRLILSAQELEGMVRHAEQGYSGFSPAIRVEQSELEMLYEYDLALLEGLKRLEEKASSLGTDGSALAATQECTAILEEFRATFKKRLVQITGTEVK